MAPISRNPFKTLMNFVRDCIDVIEQLNSSAGMTVSKLDLRDGMPTASDPLGLTGTPKVYAKAPVTLSRSFHQHVQRVAPLESALNLNRSQALKSSVSSQSNPITSRWSLGFHVPDSGSERPQVSANTHAHDDLDRALDAIFPQTSSTGISRLAEVYVPDFSQIASMRSLEGTISVSSPEDRAFPQLLEPVISRLDASEPQVLQMVLQMTESVCVSPPEAKQGFSTPVNPPHQFSSVTSPSEVCLSEVLGQGQEETTDWILLHNSRRAMDSLNRLVNDFEFMDD